MSFLAKKPFSLWKTQIQATLKLGSDVRFDTHGGTGKLTGELALSKKYNEPLLANGKIYIVEGRYTIRDRVLDIVPYSFIYYSNTPVNNPQLQIRAGQEIILSGNQPGIITKKADVGLDIKGTFARPEINFYSSSSDLTSADILSYLVLGHPANSNTSSNLVLLAQLIQQMKSKNQQTIPQRILDQLAQGLGVVELGIEPQKSLEPFRNFAFAGSINNAIIGRYLAPNIYIRYTHGFGPYLNVIQIRYLFSRHWAIQTETSPLGSGVDILYSVERN